MNHQRGQYQSGAAALILFLLASASARADGSESTSSEAAAFFENRIRPVLVERCYECHSARAEKLKGGLRLDSREGVARGGDSGRPAVVPGRPEQSRLLEAVRRANPDLQMPPKGPLTAGQIADFENWIRAGAADPRESPALPAPTVNAGSHWAFQPVRQPALPAVRAAGWVRTPVDRFILAKLEAKGWQPAPRADRRTLLRRLAYDLTGLPPTPEELDAFLRDSSPDAVGRVVERLLASPHHGERWGRHWLDVARYSDSKGYVYAREERMFIHSHPYRDWVIRALNEDLPYDRFLLLQLAADQVAPDDPPAQAAMGFLTLGRRFLGVRHDIIDDRIDVVTRGTMALTVQCARCHDHKYDPVSIRDYYSLYGVFAANAEQVVRAVPPAAGPDPESAFAKGLREREEKYRQTFAQKRAEMAGRVRARVADYLAAQFHLERYPEEGFDQILSPNDLIPGIVRRWQQRLAPRAGGFDPVFAPWQHFAARPEREFTNGVSLAPRGDLNPLVVRAFATAPGSRQELVDRYAALFKDVETRWQTLLAGARRNGGAAPASLADPAAEALRQVLYGDDSPAVIPDDGIEDTEQLFPSGDVTALWKLSGEIDRWILKAPDAPPFAVALHDLVPAGDPRVFLRGNPATPGAEVPRRFPVALARPGAEPFSAGSGRLELARAIIDPGNPLTARVLVNRVWLHHFGAGLVRTPGDLGTRAEPPSHPELLDWLTTWFVNQGWSLKRLHRLIVHSAVYQQSTTPPAAAPRLDPENRLLSHMSARRLEFEALRDSLLAAAGEIDFRMGGKGDDSLRPAGPGRRTVYGFVDRQYLPGTLSVFDFPNPDMLSPQRPETAVPQRALYFLNSPFVAERARAIARRAANAADDAARVRRMYELVYQRDATAIEVGQALRFVSHPARAVPPPPPGPAPTAWQYGVGGFDEAAGRVKDFAKLPHFTGDAWQGGPKWPDAKLGWAQLTAGGGHAGNDRQHAVVRRWIAPVDGRVSIAARLSHERAPGDGIRGFLSGSRAGLLGRWTLHNAAAETNVEAVEVQAGDTIDFVVDLGGGLNNDDFKWEPVIRLLAGPAAGSKEWNARAEFGGPPVAPKRTLTPWEQLAQVLLLSNEFVFVD